MELQRCRSCPRALEHDVLEIVANEFADARRPVDVRDDLQEEARLVESLRDSVHVKLAVLEAHRAGRDSDAPIIQRAHQRVSIDFQLRTGKLLGETPEFTSTRNRRMVVEEHRVDVATHFATKSHRDYLTRLGVVAKP